VTTEPVRWFTSSCGGGGGQCVEVATNLAASRGVVAVRDSKDPAGPALRFDADAFGAFVAGVRDGEFGAV
jgi:hypothetical protein